MRKIWKISWIDQTYGVLVLTEDNSRWDRACSVSTRPRICSRQLSGCLLSLRWAASDRGQPIWGSFSFPAIAGKLNEASVSFSTFAGKLFKARMASSGSRGGATRPRLASPQFYDITKGNAFSSKNNLFCNPFVDQFVMQIFVHLMPVALGRWCILVSKGWEVSIIAISGVMNDHINMM